MAKRSDLGPREAERLEAEVAITANTFLWLARLFAGLLVNSIALVADAWHSMSDSATSAVVLISSKLASRPPDEEHPYGHGKVADIGTLLMGVALIGIAGYIVYEASVRYLLGYELERAYAPLALAVLITTSLAKEGLARYSMKLFRRSGSTLCKADAWHHRVDALVGLATIPAITVYTITGSTLVDIAAASAIGVLLVRGGIKILKEPALALIDTAVPQIEKTVRDVAGGVAGVERVHDVRVRNYGGQYYVEVKLHVRPSMSIDEGHEIAHQLESKIKERERRIAEVLIHIEPSLHK